MFYLRPENFSPRYADEFYTVEVAVSPPSSQEMIVSSPPSPPPPPMVEGRTHHPAVYYSLVVRSGSRSRTVRRRYSQFRWLREEIGRRSALIPSYSPSSPRAEDLPLLPPRTCWGHRWSDDQFIMQRAELLGEFLLDLLSTRGGGYADHPAVVAFLELDIDGGEEACAPVLGPRGETAPAGENLPLLNTRLL